MRPPLSWSASSRRSGTHSPWVGVVLCVGAAVGGGMWTTRSTISTAERPEAAAWDCSQARCGQAGEHHCGIRPTSLTRTGLPHQPHVPAASRRRRYLGARQVDELAEAAGDGRLPVLVLAYFGLRWSEFPPYGSGTSISCAAVSRSARR